MVFTSLKFLIFLLAVIIVYFICPPKHRWIVLLVASIAFYCIASIKFVPVMLVTALITYFAALAMQKSREKLKNETAAIDDKKEIKLKKEENKKYTKRVTGIALVVAIGYLCFTKLAGLVDWLDVDSIIVPLGISYYTFSTVGYVLDVYWKRYDAETDFFRYLLFVIYFPHILQGPIARYDRVGKDLREVHYFDYDRFCYGLQLMVWGFFEKLVIADRLDIFVSPVFDDCKNQYGVTLIIAVCFYAVQIYTDFAGCVNIAMGMSQIFGIKIEDNFRQPYFSKTVDEFWRRWHMTLGAWFKDYLCMPVSLSKPVKKLSKSMREKHGAEAGKMTTTICALIAVWICTGAWHGTGWNYMIWAAWQCGIIIIGLVFKDTFAKWKTALHINEESGGWKRFQIVRTFILVGIVPRVITRANSLSDAWTIFKNIFADLNLSALTDGSLFTFGMDSKDLIMSVIGIIILYIVSRTKEKGINIRETIAGKKLPVRWAFYITALFAVIIFGIYGPGYDASTFAYMDF